MPIHVDSWQPQKVGDEVMRRLRMISRADGYNTNPHVEMEPHEAPLDSTSSNLPGLFVIEDVIRPEEGSIGSTQARGKLRWRTFFLLWGIVESSADMFRARHELLADAKSALFTGEDLPSADNTTRSALTMAIEEIEFGAAMLGDRQRGFFVLTLSVQYDLVRKE